MSELGERFWSKVNKSAANGCWEWTSPKRHGYGRYWLDGRMQSAHRLAFESESGPIPEGLVVDHVCRNRACVNPSHMQLTTNAVNLQNRKGASKRNKTTGVRGVYVNRHGSYVAGGGLGGQYYYLGSYPTLAEAEAVAVAWRRENHPNSLVDQIGATS